MKYLVFLIYLVSMTLLSSCEKTQVEVAEVEAEINTIIPRINPYKGDDAAVADGRVLFNLKCSQCHGPDAGGGPDVPGLTDADTIHGSSDEDVFRVVWYGTLNGMPAWKNDMGEENIWKVMAYVESLKLI